MSLILDGDGTISGLSVGGLSNGVITPEDLNGAQSGSAPGYVARAWVNFNGSTPPSIRASGNVSSVTRSSEGVYVVNFTTAMPDANYSVSGLTNTSTGQTDGFVTFASNATPLTTSSTTIQVRDGTGGNVQDASVTTLIFMR